MLIYQLTMQSNYTQNDSLILEIIKMAVAIITNEEPKGLAQGLRLM